MAKHDLTYRLLSDSTMEASRAFGIAFVMDDKLRETYASFGIDIAEASGREHFELPVPSVFLVGTDGKILFRYFNPDHRVRIQADDLLAAAQEHR